MSNAIYKIEKPANEPVLSYRPGSPEREELKAKLKELKSREIEIPLIIGGKEVKTGDFGECRMPHDHQHRLAVYHKAGPKEIEMAIEAAREAKKEWARMAWEDRIAIFRKAAELLAGPYRSLLNAATMLGQSKNVFQAEIDSACELIDFFRFNTYYATQIYKDQPYSPVGFWNRMEYRPLEGFVFAVTPFNFTSIAGNLPTSPAMLGNTVLWKPASSAIYSAYYIMKLLEEAGLPPGVINFIPGSGSKVGDYVLASPELAGIHFTGSTEVFKSMWRTVGENIEKYNTYPRIVGETGGKDFVFVHESAQVAPVVTALIRGAFEYQGQKCSAASRAYIPDNRWEEIKEELLAQISELKMGSPEDFTNFVNAVIDKNAYQSIKEYIDYAKAHEDAEILIGGNCDDSKGYFIEPTVILAKTPDFKTMREEIFGPVLTVYVYDADKYEETLHICDQTSPYGLTGSIFAQDRKAIVLAEDILVNAAGNFYINDKPTGAVVGQQPFGGSRASGTNDKAGSYLNLLRWVSPRAIKETFVPPVDYRYPFMEEE
ncbi:1-pyrroline-5-carboxylate dehydrogenase [Anoxybacter fermentans]|uniref:L-glutamate gamma-semialdehyde dehydrogenase n=1 Tax=Anoxybacter fermentans TaxID=1323375 RepID=A0A3Q9HP97_9FIRM|nr:L-glutamate gamma-semialdehyde dehydrogenase [Anoxybacter fermentans]AZR72474.1 1-pyrroline-5-carboxylate dehydrogenase [Anoxybacter fermentans]